MHAVVFWWTVCLLIAAAVALPPDKPPDEVSPSHIIKPRSIDINSAIHLASEQRLNGGVEPHHYTIKFILQDNTRSQDTFFRGLVTINVTFHKDVDHVKFHCEQYLDIYRGEVHMAPNLTSPFYKIPVGMLDRDYELHLASLKLMNGVKKDHIGWIELDFGGTMKTTTANGFFRTTYYEKDAKRYAWATQFRPTNARLAFPCFDEPGLKATFELSIVKPKHMVGLTNAPMVASRDTDNPEDDWVFFERTPPMSTYEVGWMVGNIQQLAKPTTYKYDTGNETELCVWGRPEFLPALEGANERLATVFKEMADFWNVPLPLKQINVVAMPNYNGVKPMDSWGLIIFKESDLANKGYLQLAQEICYQWVGGLATPQWWTDLHMNKALAGFLAAETALKVNSGTEMEGKWPMTVLYSLYYEYSKRYPHSRITGMKQETMCTKMELVFRMLNYTLGHDIFRDGLRKFMMSKKYQTFRTPDVWSALNEVTQANLTNPVDVIEVAKSWVDQNRLPLITALRNYENNTLHVSQKVYLRERPHDVPHADRILWLVPLVIAREDKLEGKRIAISGSQLEWMPKEKNVWLRTPMPSKEYFIIVNPEEIGPFPVNYDLENWNLLSKFLQSNKRDLIPELTRAKLLHDAWNLAYAGELSFRIALNMTLFLKDEKHHLVWDPVFTMIDHIGRHLSSGVRDKFEAYVKTLLTHLYEYLKANEKEDEDPSQKNLRTMTKNFLCQAGYKPCVLEAQAEFGKWMQAENPDEGNPIMNQHICPVFRYGSLEEWEFGLERVVNFPADRKQSERTYLLKTLAGCPKDDFKINRLLNDTILDNPDDFSDTDLHLIFSMLAGNCYGSATLLRFLDTHWELLKNRYRNNTHFWDSFINTATSSFITDKGLEMVSNLYVAHQGEFKSAEHLIEKNIKNIREEAQWSIKNLPVMEQWLDEYFAKNNGTNTGKTP